MHPDPTFHVDDLDGLLALARMRPFATVIAVEDGRAHVEHTPVLCLKDADVTRLRFCLCSSSEVARIISGGTEAMVVFTGPDAYVSADWLGEPDGLPYWNYLSAEARGSCGPLSEEALIATYHEMSARYEKREHPSPEEAVALRIYAEQMKDMVGFDMIAASFVGVRKLSQDKRRDARAQAGEKLANSGGDRAIAAMMMNQGK